MHFRRQAQFLGVLGSFLSGGYAQAANPGGPIKLDVTSAGMNEPPQIAPVYPLIMARAFSRCIWFGA